jgi:hypothetical protein
LVLFEMGCGGVNSGVPQVWGLLDTYLGVFVFVGVVAAVLMGVEGLGDVEMAGGMVVVGRKEV